MSPFTYFRCPIALVFATAFAMMTVLGPAVKATGAGGSALDPATDLAVRVSAPRVIVRGSNFQATVSISNLGKTAARSVKCGVGNPRADAVTGFRLNVPTMRSFDPVHGYESREFSFSVLAPGQVRTVSIYGTTVTGTSTPDFTISAFCVPAPVDNIQSNNSATVTVGLYLR